MREQNKETGKYFDSEKESMEYLKMVVNDLIIDYNGNEHKGLKLKKYIAFILSAILHQRDFEKVFID